MIFQILWGEKLQRILFKRYRFKTYTFLYFYHQTLYTYKYHKCIDLTNLRWSWGNASAKAARKAFTSPPLAALNECIFLKYWAAMSFIWFLLLALALVDRSTFWEGFSWRRAIEKKTALKWYLQSSAEGSSRKRWIESTETNHLL